MFEMVLNTYGHTAARGFSPAAAARHPKSGSSIPEVRLLVAYVVTLPLTIASHGSMTNLLFNRDQINAPITAQPEMKTPRQREHATRKNAHTWQAPWPEHRLGQFSIEQSYPSHPESHMQFPSMQVPCPKHPNGHSVNEQSSPVNHGEHSHRCVSSLHVQIHDTCPTVNIQETRERRSILCRSVQPSVPVSPSFPVQEVPLIAAKLGLLHPSG